MVTKWVNRRFGGNHDSADQVGQGAPKPEALTNDLKPHRFDEALAVNGEVNATFLPFDSVSMAYSTARLAQAPKGATPSLPSGGMSCS